MKRANSDRSMDCSSIWTTTKTLELIELYRQNRMLWDYHHADYTNNRKRYFGFERIAQQLDPNISVDAVKAKLKSLRTQFARNVHQMDALRRQHVEEGTLDQDTNYTRPWRYFEPMRFLMDVISQPDGATKAESYRYYEEPVSNAESGARPASEDGKFQALLFDDLSTAETDSNSNADGDESCSAAGGIGIETSGGSGSELAPSASGRRGAATEDAQSEGVLDGGVSSVNTTSRSLFKKELPYYDDEYVAPNEEPDPPPIVLKRPRHTAFRSSAPSLEHRLPPLIRQAPAPSVPPTPPHLPAQPAEDQYDHFARYAAATLRQIHESNRANAMLGIQQLLLHYSMAPPAALPPTSLASMNSSRNA